MEILKLWFTQLTIYTIWFTQRIYFTLLSYERTRLCHVELCLNKMKGILRNFWIGYNSSILTCFIDDKNDRLLRALPYLPQNSIQSNRAFMQKINLLIINQNHLRKTKSWKKCIIFSLFYTLNSEEKTISLN